MDKERSDIGHDEHNRDALRRDEERLVRLDVPREAAHEHILRSDERAWLAAANEYRNDDIYEAHTESTMKR